MRIKKDDFLTKAQKKNVRDYWRKYVIITNYKDCKFYTTRTSTFDVRYISDSFFFAHCYRLLNDCAKTRYIDDKNYYDMFFHDLNQAKTLIRKRNKVLLDADYHLLSLKEAMKICLDEKSLILKIAKSSFGGHGVFFYDNINENFLEIINSINDDFIIQTIIKQHPVMSMLNESSVNTIRIMTFMDNNQVTILSSIVRMGLGNSRVDNASSGGITCGILPSGQLKNIAFSPLGEKYDKHPTNGLVFSKITIPNYNLVKEMVIKAHQRFPEFSLLSWDIALDQKEKPIFIEVNMDAGELDFHQLNNGPIFGNQTEYILNKICRKRKIIN